MGRDHPCPDAAACAAVRIEAGRAGADGVLSAILLVVAYNMGEWREIPELWKHGWTDRMVWMSTFALTVAGGSDGGRRSRHDHRAVSCSSDASRRRRRVTRDQGVRPARTCTCSRQGIPAYVTIFPYPRTVPVRRHRQARGSGGALEELAPIVVSSLAQHDGDRRNRTPAIQEFADTCTRPAGRLLLCGALPQRRRS